MLRVVMMLLAMASAVPAWSQDRARRAADCMQRAMTTGLQRVPSSQAEAARVVERNFEKKASQGRRCVSISEAESLGRVSLFIDTFGPACGLGPAPVLRRPSDPNWGDVDLLNGAAAAYRGDAADGPFFAAQKQFREQHAGTPDRRPGAVCAEFWRDYGPSGIKFPGLLVRIARNLRELPAGSSDKPLSGKSTGADYVDATTTQRVRWTLSVAELAGENTPAGQMNLAARIHRCLEVALTGTDSWASQAQELAFMSAFCAMSIRR